MRILKFVYLVTILTLFVSCKRNLPGFSFDSFNSTPVEKLARAVKEENLQLIEDLVLYENMLVDYLEPEYGHSLLMLAVANGLEYSVLKLLKLGANPNLRSKLKEGQDSSYIDTPMFIACDNIINNACNMIILKSLIKYNGKVNDEIKIQYVGANYQSVKTPLMEASKGTCLNIVRLLVDSGADINKYNYSEGHGPISNAIIYDRMEILRYLIIDKKAKIPSYCYVRHAYNESPRQELTVTEFLKEKEYQEGSKEFQIKEEILDYLKK